MCSNVETGRQKLWMQKGSNALNAIQPSGDPSAVAPPVPIPNTEVKRCSPDDSTSIGCAKVGRRQSYAPFLAKAGNGALVFYGTSPFAGKRGARSFGRFRAIIEHGAEYIVNVTRGFQFKRHVPRRRSEVGHKLRRATLRNLWKRLTEF